MEWYVSLLISLYIIYLASAGSPFLKAAVGNDSLTPGNGEYRIIQNNQFLTTHQTISSVKALSKDSNDDDICGQILISGSLLYQSQKSADYRGFNARKGKEGISKNREPLPVLKYEIVFTETSSEELKMHIRITDIPDRHPEVRGHYDRIILTYSVDDDEEVFGLGEQFSYWSLKGQKVPIITREQGIGRGLQPITYILNHIPPAEPSYSGGDPLSTYTAIAHYLTSKGRSIFVHNPELSIFDFTVTNRATVEVVSRSMTKSVFYATRPLDIIKAYTKSISGRQNLLPDWVSGAKGAVIGIQGGEEKVYEVVKSLIDRNVPVAAIWLQDWVGTRIQPVHISFPIPVFRNRTATVSIKSTRPQKRLWWNWEHDSSSYPNWPKFVERLKREFGVKVMTYVNPFLSDIENGGKPDNSWRVNYFQEASEKGYLIKRWVKVPRNKNFVPPEMVHPASEKEEVGIGGRQLVESQKQIEDPEGEWHLVDYVVSSGPGVNAGMIDLSNPDAFEWFKDVIKDNMVEHGISGWMADFAEYLPFDGVLHSQLKTTTPPGSKANLFEGESVPVNPHSFHNVYPREWARLNREVVDEMKEKNGEEIVFFMRSAYADSPKYCNAFWNGDQLHTWDQLDGLESTIYGSLSASLSGMAFTHSDIGGYTTLNIDPRVSLTIGGKVTRVKLPILDRRARFVRQDKELFYRWMENSVFTSIAMYRTHEGSVPDENLQVWSDPEISETFAYFAQMHGSLHNYRKILMREHSLNGNPVLRPLFLHYPHGNWAASQMDRLAYLYGPILLVIPITTPGITSLNQKVFDNNNLTGFDQDKAFDSGSSDDEMMNIDSNEDLDSSSSDGEVFEFDDDPRAKFMKRRLMNNVGHLAREGVVSALNMLLKSLPFSIPDASKNPGDSFGTSPPRPSMLHATKRLSIDDHPLSKSMSNSPLISRSLEAPKNRRPIRRQNPVLAPTRPPKPHHGLPLIPTGVWTHVVSGTRIESKDPNGIFVTEKYPALINCEIGKPAVFLREISEAEMTKIIETGLSGKRCPGGEDWRYWLENDDGSLVINGKDPEDLVLQAMQKYRKLRSSIEEFIDYLKSSNTVLQ